MAGLVTLRHHSGNPLTARIGEAGLATLAITVGGLAFVRLALIDALGLAREPAEPPAYTGWATWAPGWLWPFWGIALAVATIAYYHCRHDQGRAAAGPRLGQGAPC
jgi:hypothetical protein